MEKTDKSWEDIKWTYQEVLGVSIDEDIKNADWLEQKTPTKTAEPPKPIRPQP